MSLRSRFADKAWYRLTAHFFVGLFDFGVLSEAGSDAFQRVLIGIIATMLTFGLLFARITRMEPIVILQGGRPSQTLEVYRVENLRISAEANAYRLLTPLGARSGR